MASPSGFAPTLSNSMRSVFASEIRPIFPGPTTTASRISSGRSDGDVVFQPRKVERSGISEAVDGHVLIYIHKEDALDDVQRRYPADHYVMVDDKVRILTAIKKAWGERVTTVFPRQGKFAHDAAVLASNPRADIAVERISDLLEYDLPGLLAGRRHNYFTT